VTANIGEVDKNVKDKNISSKDGGNYTQGGGPTQSNINAGDTTDASRIEFNKN